jgi:hypothetical protein
MISPVLRISMQGNWLGFMQGNYRGDDLHGRLGLGAVSDVGEVGLLASLLPLAC